ncbi:hypothetical protein ACFQ0X_10290 [Streptomyces rectiviolaceus]|uniref:Uncharacterized protein n=1 Tax=Streptomyces rectiviolaceus TaxID=332591 RepID=A0ABP6MCV4_9ACTN
MRTRPRTRTPTRLAVALAATLLLATACGEDAHTDNGVGIAAAAPKG